ncbi:uroporphyrin-III C-methyltransferase [Neisseria meningitidis]|uniref:uroporphyrinogen-III C-methyltransferase n=1 Tax=Neisseria meningitidis TaxID=487 RepID=UPI0002DED6E3|nr:uroporphyrinogen-III C-methyltransferase [Neisseria meningitidis]CWN19435.1 uroporphyrin-III C-methyltransferase [Neisseria meningitidis]CWO81724.1 uroporphyrin-III C-methyltransferase [Neisseria meningitidis]CWP29386.1 uroporphyrin-III C-methyltransferase [Neisseria meningitidis]CWP58479.1 uroporphyrin-III C-methyltransferase [Neisseria meningitidis]CWR02276.1 uroporphyrin-III C-methyltransferase [Neisseria meningitidis]
MGEPENKSSEPVREIQASKEMPSETSSPRKENETEVHIPAAPFIVKQSGSNALAVCALVLAALGLGTSGFLFVQGQNVLKNQELAFNQKIDKAALGESENAALLKDNLNRQAAIQSELDRLDSGVKANGEQILMTQKAYRELTKGRADWLVDETDTILNLAAQQLVLTGNIQTAVGVLEHIDSRLSRFDQAELLPIKQAVSSDLAELKNRPYVDISGTALRLDRLETAVFGLPLILDGVLKPGVQVKNEAASASWWQNVWEKSLGTLKGLVEIRRLENNDAMLISPEQAYFVRENLRLRLLDARTALMQRNSEVYQGDLNNAETAVRQYFDAKSPATQSWLKELAELKALDVRMTADDGLKNSLNAVRAYRDGTRMTTAENQEAEQATSEPANENTASEPAAASDVKTIEAPSLPSERKPEQPAKKQPVPEKAGRSPSAKGERA